MLSTLMVFFPLLLGFVTYGLAIRRILVTRSTAGTSATSLVVSAISCLAWGVWAIWQNYPALAWVNLLWIPLLILPELAAMAKVKPLQWGSWLMVPVWAGAVLVGTIISLAGGPDLLGVVLAVSGLLWLAPALRELYRHQDVTGVSATSWSISGVSVLLWGAYGLLEGAWTASLYSAVQIAGILAALLRIYWLYRKKSGATTLKR